MHGWNLRLVAVFIAAPPATRLLSVIAQPAPTLAHRDALPPAKQKQLQKQQALPAPQTSISESSLADLVAKQARTTMLELVSEARQRPGSSGSASSTQPELRGARLAQMAVSDSPDVLVDSGASHAARPAGQEEDWSLLREVLVKVVLGPDQKAVLDPHDELVSPQAGDIAMSLGRYIQALDLAFFWDRDGATLKDNHSGEAFSLFQKNFSPYLSRPDLERLREAVRFSDGPRPDPHSANLFLESLAPSACQAFLGIASLLKPFWELPPLLKPFWELPALLKPFGSLASVRPPSAAAKALTV
eukprot:Skav204275  [mRNA]  locus=scaffold409:109909:110814:- [translate_table: standard]